MSDSNALANPAASTSNPVQDEAEPDKTMDPEVNGTAAHADANGTQATRPDEEMRDADSAALDRVLAEARIPAKKDATLREFLSKMDDCAPIVSREDLLVFFQITLISSI
jgi:transcription initiation factor TFIID subunit 10